MRAAGDIVWTYDVRWEYSDVKWASRWDVYLYATDEQIHWFSILNSLAIVLLLSGIVAMIMVRTLLVCATGEPKENAPFDPLVTFGSLPDDALASIMDKLSAQEAARAEPTSKTFRRLTGSPEAWHTWRSTWPDHPFMPGSSMAL